MVVFIFRLLVVAACVWLGLRIYKSLVNRYENPSAPDSQQKDTQQGEPMHPCKICGVHVLESRSLRRDGNFYCSKEHLEQHLDK